jgi:LCP family protein required for cell wall assembly
MSYGGERRRRASADPKTERLPHGTQPRRHVRRQPQRRTQQSPKGMVAGRSVMALVSAAVLVGTGAAWRVYDHAVHSITTSDAISDGPKSSGQDQNILLMGLDSRLDEHGRTLPQAMYDALHAGDDTVAQGMNANVLMLIHIPGDGSKSTAISIPRDDFATLDPTDCGGETCKGKIKEAYGRAYGAVHDKYAGKIKDPLALDAKARDAGRKAETNTVSKFLGDVPIDHFVEITLAAFFQIAEKVQPITVCLNEKTSDSYSGANFHKGRQQINASQAMAFVRQRRDPDESLNFTDLDRTRRQQAFIVSLAHQLQSSGTMSSPSTLMGLLSVAQQNMAVDSGLDLGKFAAQASSLMSGGLALYTLPIQDFGTDPSNGEAINKVDLDKIHTYVQNLLNPPKPGASTTSAAPTTTSSVIPSAQGIVVSVVNGSGHDGLGGEVEKALAARGFTQGEASTGSPRSGSTLLYGSGAATAANALASQLGMTATASSSLNSDAIQLTVGTEASKSGPIADIVSAMGGSDSKTTTTTPPPPPVSATAIGENSPAPTDLSSMDGKGIPCVK